MTTHADHREPWHPDCATCRTGIDPLTDAEPWAVPAEEPRRDWLPLIVALLVLAAVAWRLLR